MKTTIYLVRHGTTTANLENRFAGRTGEVLHQKGEEQLRQVGRKLAPLGISAIYSGTLPRTVQSAGILSEMLGAMARQLAELNDMYIPHWDGLTKDDIRTRYGDEYPTWLASPHLFEVEGCEVLADVQNRAVAALSRAAAEQAGGSLVVVSHLIVLRVLVLYFQGRPLAEFRSVKIGNGDIVCLQLDVSSDSFNSSVSDVRFL